MSYLIAISFFIFSIYMLGMYLMFGITPSISETYYKLERRKKGMGWLFTAMCWLVAFTIVPPLLDRTSENQQFLIFLSGAGLGFVGVAPLFKIRPERLVHYIGAFICMGASQMWALLNCWWSTILVWVIYIAATMWYMNKHITARSVRDDYLTTKPMYWVEIASFTALYLAILFG